MTQRTRQAMMMVGLVLGLWAPLAGASWTSSTQAARSLRRSGAVSSSLTINAVGMYRWAHGAYTPVSEAQIGDTITFSAAYSAPSALASSVRGAIRFAHDGKLSLPQAMKTALGAKGQHICYIAINFGAASAQWLIGAVEVRFTLQVGGQSAQRALSFTLAAAPSRVQPPDTVAPLAPLTPRSGYVIGRATFEDGRPIPRFTIKVNGYDAQQLSSADGMPPSLGNGQGSNGRYAIQVRNTLTGQPVKALVTSVRAYATLRYHGYTYTIELYPRDGKLNLGRANDFRGDSAAGVVRDFVLKLGGLKPGAEAYRGRETETTDTAVNAFYGGNMTLTLSGDTTPGSDFSNVAPAGITIRFVPNGPLIDGSRGSTVVRTIQLKAGAYNYYFYLHSIPIGVYTATAQLTPANGTVRSLRLRFVAPQSLPWATSAPVWFDPTSGGGDGSYPMQLDLAQ